MSEYRMLVVGAGATGGVFGGRLAQAGRDVSFLVRPARAAQLRERGLRIHAPGGDVALQPQLIESGSIEGPYDAVLIGLKAYAFERAIDDFARAVGPDTVIVPMMNGMQHIDRLVERFGERPVLGGVCVVAATLDKDGDVVMLFDLQQLAYGERGGGISERVTRLDRFMQDAGFTANASPHIMQDMWDKWIFLASLGAATCLMRGSVGAIAGAGGASLTLEILDEAASIASAAGFPPADNYLDETRARLTAAGSSLASSMYRDLQQGLPVEADHIIGDLLARGTAFGLRTPLLQAAYVQLSIYQQSLTART